MSKRNIVLKLASAVTFGALSALLCGAGSSRAAAYEQPDTARCGGPLGLTCNANEWCEYEHAGGCGDGDDMGTCRPRPGSCPENCPGVTGCDGKFYCNACLAHQARNDVSARHR